MIYSDQALPKLTCTNCQSLFSHIQKTIMARKYPAGKNGSFATSGPVMKKAAIAKSTHFATEPKENHIHSLGHVPSSNGIPEATKIIPLEAHEAVRSKKFYYIRLHGPSILSILRFIRGYLPTH